jgi:multidrug efflux pump subunit AcrA (membrane-fusion protein)
MSYEEHKNKTSSKASAGANVPPNLFEDERISKGSKQKWGAFFVGFAVIAALVVWFPYSTTIQVTGKTVPQQIWSVDAPFAGMIVESVAQKGNVIQAGERLLVLESESLSSQLRTLTQETDILATRIKMLEGNIREAKEISERKRIYYEVGTIALNDRKSAVSQLNELEGNLKILSQEREKAEAKRKDVETLSDKGVLNSPVDGIVYSEIKNQQGERVSEGEELLEIASPGCNFEIAVSEEEARLMEIGAKADIRLASAPFKVYQGRVVRKEAKVEEEIDRVWYKTHKVHVLIEPLEGIPLVPGMQADVKIPAQQKTSLLRRLVIRTLF